MAGSSELLVRAAVSALAVTFLVVPAACSGSGSSPGSRAGSAGTASGGAPSGGNAGRGMGVGGAGQATKGGAAGQAGGTTGRDGSSGASGGRGGTAAGGQAGEVAHGGTAGDMHGMSGEGGSELMGGSGGSGGSGGGSGGSCRRYAAEYTVDSSGSLTTVSCTFDRPSLAMTCTTGRGDVTTTTWATIEDAVGEYQPIGLRRAARVEQLIAFPAGECRLTQDFRSDDSGRLTAMEVTVDPSAPCGTNEATYDAWDSDGRTTHGIENGVGGETCAGGEVTMAYDDAARTITTIRSGGTDCLASSTVLNHDEDGLRTSATNAGGTTTSTYVTLLTGEICK